MAIQFKGNQAAADAQDKYPVAPEGTVVYMTVVAATEKKSKESGRDMMELEHVVSHGEFADRVRVWHYLTFLEESHKSHGMTLHALHAYGFDTEGDNEYSGEAFVGRGVKVELGVDEYKGRRKNVIKKFLIDEEPGQEEPQQPAAPPTEEPTPPWVNEGTRAGAAATAAARPPVKPQPAPARKLPWTKKK